MTKRTPYRLGLTLGVALVLGFGLGMLMPESSNHEKNETNYRHLDAEIKNLSGFTRPQPITGLTVNGDPVALNGPFLTVGSTLTNSILDKPSATFDAVQSLKLSDLSGFVLIHTVPSLDTPVCTAQTKMLERAAVHFSGITFAIISHDTPFALQRFCGDNTISNLFILSDARLKDFGTKNGFIMSGYNLLTRAIMIIDDTQTIRYIDYGGEVTSPLDIYNALGALKSLTQKQ
ncbi:MAG: redoxin domain-containing protein [Candidatus Absconditabacterales bacterium]|nr:redoxin domain-containing protein [Candidatus Absconditabacterales bacterium]